MDKKKKSPAEEPDELSLVKAAAWAWYQRNSSSSSSSPSSEPPSASRRLSYRRKPTHRPSRYHIESLSKNNPPLIHPSTEKEAPITLFDLYEIERIGRELERLVLQSEKKETKEEKRSERKSKGGGGLWGRHAVMICGSEENPVEEVKKVGRRRVRSSEFF